MSRDLIERARKRAENGKVFHTERKLFAELADRIAALEAEASEGERRGLERAAEVAEELEIILHAPDGWSYLDATRALTAARIRALIPEAPAQRELGSAAANQISTPEFGLPENPEDDPRYPALLADAKARVRNENLDGSPRRHALPSPPQDREEQ